jgi:hypothetical protein
VKDFDALVEEAWWADKTDKRNGIGRGIRKTQQAKEAARGLLIGVRSWKELIKQQNITRPVKYNEELCRNRESRN